MSCERCASLGLACVEHGTAPAEPPMQLLDNLDHRSLAQGAFPDDCDSPARLEQVLSVAPVPFRVGIKLGLPELLASARCGRVQTAGVPVPEAAVHKAHSSKLTKHEVWCAWESAVVQTVSKPVGVDGSAKKEFRPRVPASDPRHHARTSLAVHYVCHRRPSRTPEQRYRQQSTRQVSDLIQHDRRLHSGAGPIRYVSPSFGHAPSKDRAVGGVGNPGTISPFERDP